MGVENGLFKEDVFNEDNLKASIDVLRKLLANFPAIHKLNYQYATDTLTEKDIVGNSKTIDIKLMVAWGIIDKVDKDAYKLNPYRVRTLSAAILILQN